MLDGIRKVLDRKRPRPMATRRRFSIESLEDRLNFSMSAPATMDVGLAAAIQERLSDSPALEASRVTVSVTETSWGTNLHSSSSVLFARRFDEPAPASSLRAQRDKGLAFVANRPALEASRLSISFGPIYLEPAFVFVPAIAPPSVFVYEVTRQYSFFIAGPPRRPAASNWTFTKATSAEHRSLASVQPTFYSDAPAPVWDVDAEELQQSAAPHSLNPARLDLALASFQKDRSPLPSSPIATNASATRSGDPSVESSSGVALYGGEGGLIDLGGGRYRDLSLGQKLLTNGPHRAEEKTAPSSVQDLPKPLSDSPEKATPARDDKPHIEQRVNLRHERTLADSAEGGLIDLVDVSAVGELLAEQTVMIAASEASRSDAADSSDSSELSNSRESNEPIEVDRSIGLFRAFELAVGPEGDIAETVNDATPVSSERDSTIETPVSIDAGNLNPAVIPGAAAIPAVLMVASWAHTNRRKRDREIA